MFFATYYVPHGKWRPTIGNQAVLYTIDYASFIQKGVLPLGMSIGQAEQWLSKSGYRITSEPCPMPDEAFWQMVYQAWLPLRQEYLRRARFRFVSDPIE